MVNIALCQMKTTLDKTANIEKATAMIAAAAKAGAQIVMLPEMFNCPYGNQYFAPYSEAPFGPTVAALAQAAKTNGVYLIGGSLPEREENKLYNTCYVFDPQGEVLGKYRKMHLFDIAVSNGVTFQESAVLTAGDTPLIVDTAFGKIGVMICFDIRFPELARILALEGAQAIFMPAAFNMTTGPAHWHLSIRMRAVDNQLYFAAASPARDNDFSYVAYGHSLLADPWGNIVCEADEKEQIIYGAMDLTQVTKIRQELPLLSNRRQDIYQLHY